VIKSLVYSISSNVLKKWADSDSILAPFEKPRGLKANPTAATNYSHGSEYRPTVFVFQVKLIHEESCVHHSIKLNVNGTSGAPHY